ncbi:MAG: ABC transporter ATP-binding protein [Burkholderiaceae bacterium]|nr:ABC transporter ATP-binding protein [Burkholderiaceae bacterium]
MSTVLRARSLAFGHHGRPLGDPVSLEIGAGEVLCLLGPNGCGKTTLFRTVLGLVPALGGSVEIAGRDLVRVSRMELARCVAYVPQAHAGVFAYAVEDVVLMGRAARLGPFSMPSRADRAIALDALQRLGVAHLRLRAYTEISGGERQLVLIARALAQQAPLVVMDEPTASLDFGNQSRVLREIATLRDRGMAVFLSTHQPEHALRIADRVALMKAGCLLAQGPARSVMSAEALAALYGLDIEEVVRSIRLDAHAA